MSTKLACFTQAAKEEYNLREFGDVILLDGTTIDNHVRWDTFPVTVLDRNRQIASGGIFFLGLQNSEVFQWVLAVIFEGGGEKWITLTTDEGCALMIAIPNFVRDGHHIRHYICVFHRYGNIRKNIKKQKAPKDTKMQLVEQIQTICYGTSAEEVEQALDEVMRIAPELSHYLHITVRPVIPMFSDCCKGDILMLRYRATSVAESANAMIPNHLPRRSLRLCKLQSIITRAYAYKFGIRFRPILMSDEMREILRTTHLNLEENII